MNEELEAFLEHHGIKGQRWGIKRNPKTGVRPLAKTFNNKFGSIARKNVNAHYSRRRAIKRFSNDPQRQKKFIGTAAVVTVIGASLALGGSHITKILKEHGAKKAAGIVFQKGGTTVFKSGTFHPGDFMDASVPVRQLTEAAKMLTRGGG
jgi:hypothetical protein